ncbi:MAG: hypothetical protein WC050_04110 [Candidatus Paceibacterota bacterium]
MNQPPVSSFVKFSLGFLVFLSVSFGVTIAVNTYASGQTQEQQTASALAAMLKTH